MPLNETPNPPTNMRMVDDEGMLTRIWSAYFDQFWAKTVADLKKQVADLSTTVISLADEIHRNAISASNTVPTGVFTQTDAGTDVLVTMAAHKRLYDDGLTVDVNATTIHVPYTTDAAFYYDDPTRVGGSVTLHYTTLKAEARANYVPGRHSLGGFITIAAGATPPTDPSGGSFAPGGSTHYAPSDLP